MQPEAEEPAHRGLAALGAAGNDTVLADPRVVADGQIGRVDEADAGTGSELGVQVGGQGHQDRGEQGREAGIAHQCGNSACQCTWTYAVE